MSLRDNWRALSPEAKVATIVAVLIPIVIFIAEPVRDAATKEKKTAKLELIDYTVYNKTDVSSPPKLEIRLHNTGNQRSLLRKAIFEVRSFAYLSICDEQGGWPETGVYDVDLPTHQATNQTIEKKIDQQLAPDEGDRFSFRFSVPPDDLVDKAPYFYQLDVSLLHDKVTRPLPVGSIVISVPTVPTAAGGEFWAKSYRADKQLAGFTPAEVTTITSCLRSNSAILRRILSLEGQRSEELENISKELG
jgi:hypothetical protein